MTTVSDVWQGPGWWLAPDGKWYPEDGGPTESARPDTAGAGSVPTGSGAPATDAGGTGDGAVAAPERPDPAEAGPAEDALAGIGIADAGEAAGVASDDAIGEDSIEAEPRGGWTAVEPAEATSAGPDLGDDARWAEEDAAVPVRRPASTTEPIERDDAWRKPGEGGEPLDAIPPSPAPAVVDVAETTGEFLPEPSEVVAPSPWRGVLLALGFLAAIIGVSILVGLFFTNVVFDDDDDGVSTSESTTSTQSAPSTDEPATTELTATPTTEDPSLGTEVSVFELETGDCIEGDIGSGPLERLVRVDCSVPHQFEVYTEDVLDASITEFDEEAINAAAEAICREALDAYIPADDDRNIQFKWFQPTAESWAQAENPDRAITCLLFDADGPMTGRAA